MSKELSMASIERTLTKLTGKWQKKHGEMPPGAVSPGVERRTPASELEEKEHRLGIREPEPLPLFEGAIPQDYTPFEILDDHLAGLKAESEESIRMFLEASAWLLDFFFQEGPNPVKAMRWVYAWVKKFRPSNIWDAGYRDLGDLLGESHAAMEWRISQLDKFATGKGIVGNKMPWQRGQDVCDGYAAAQKNNVNRLGGKKSRKRELLAELATRKTNGSVPHFSKSKSKKTKPKKPSK